MSSDLLVFSVLPSRYLQKEACFRLASDYTGTEWRTYPRRIPKQISRNRYEAAPKNRLSASLWASVKPGTDHSNDPAPTNVDAAPGIVTTDVAPIFRSFRFRTVEHKVLIVILHAPPSRH
jgi:hypothetical protein